MRKVLVLIYFFPILINSQKHDYNWLLGYGNSLEPKDTFGISIMNFNTSSLNPQIYFDKEKRIDFNGANVCMSDKVGNYIFTTNSKLILDASNNTMLNGNAMDNSNNSYTSVIPQTILALPTSSIDKYILIHDHATLTFTSIAATPIYYSIVDMAENNGLGKVVKKQVVISNDTLEFSKLTATRHANGRDWWLALGGYDTNFIYTFIVQDTTIRLNNKQKVDSIIYNGYGQATFAPNGEFYANISSISDQKGTKIYLYKFDRCSGHFTPIDQWHVNKTIFDIGVAFSPDSKIFYFNFWPYIFQIDLQSPKKRIDTLAINDYYIEDIGGGFKRYNPFGFLQLGPDNRLYCVPNSESRNMHVINHPNVLGEGAELKQHYIKFPSLHLTLPMHPNFRLGPIDGSPCDSLSIDNVPVAEFRYNQDTTNYLKINFTDLSYYEPTQWHWDFGDPNSPQSTSMDTSPIHTFSATGVYDVCLTVKNTNGQNTECKKLQLGTTSTKKAIEEKMISIYPNPVREKFTLFINDYLPIDAHLVLTDQMGNVKYTGKVYHGWNSIDISTLLNGIYYISCSDLKRDLGKCIVIKI
jgi:PKD repeat protein